MPLSGTVAFLRCVLPSEGYYVATVIKPYRKQFVCETIEGLASRIIDLDQEGATVYHACASFKDPKGVWSEQKKKWEIRCHSNAYRVRSLWLDIDAGDGKPYATGLEAYTALREFVEAVGLPVPIVVGSGFGIHVYWPLSDSILLQEWQVLAEGLKALCLKYGLHADPSRTADVSSILRTPGTHNRKNGGEVLVECGEPVSNYPNGLFSYLRQIGSVARVPATIVRRSGNSLSVSDAILSDSPSAYPAADADRIAAQCAQVGAFRRSGNLPEPVWHADVGVTSWCQNGREITHRWSANGYPGYTYEETEGRIDRVLQLTGATTCAKLDSVNPGVCSRCVHFGKIKSPISLAAAVSARQDDCVGPVATKAGVDNGALELPQLRDPFHWSDKGQLLVRLEGNNGESTNTVVTNQPFYLESVQHGELSRGSYSYRFRRLLPLEGWSEVVVDAKVIHGPQGISELAGLGAVIHDGKLFMNYVRQAVDDYHQETATQTRYDQFGWKNDNTAFLFGKMLYTAAGPVTAICAKEAAECVQWLGPKPRGNIHAWTEAADSLFASEMEALGAIVLASFAAVFMRFQSETEGGAIIHAFTPESGTGKTTALLASASVWGVKEGVSLTNEDTKVSKPIRIGTLANLPVIYDELYDRDPETIKRLVIMFTEGRDRMRGMVDGTIRHTKANWQTVLISAANQSIVEQLDNNTIDATALRVLELTASLRPDTDRMKGQRLIRVLEANAGHAGEIFLRYLVAPGVLPWARQALDQWTQEIWDRTKLGNQHRFRVRLVAAIAVAAAIVNKLDILHFNAERIVNYLVKQLTLESNAGSVSNVVPAERAMWVLGEFLRDHYGECLVVQDAWKPKQAQMHPIQTPKGKLSLRYEVNTKRVYIAKESFRVWCLERQHSPKTVLKALQESHVIVGYGRAVTLSAGTSIPGAQVPVIEANADHPVMSGIVALVDALQAQGGAV